MEELVRFSLTGPRQQVAIATLVREKPLNSLLLETIDQLAENINAWLADDSIACIVLDSSSELAFASIMRVAVSMIAQVIDRDPVPTRPMWRFPASGRLMNLN